MQSKSLRTLAVSAVITAGLGAAPLPVAAQAPYPSKPLTIVVPFAAGGGTDLLARFWGAALEKDLGQTVIADVRPGAGGSIGMRHAAQAPADGYTLLIATPAFMTNPFTMLSPGYDPLKDFRPVAMVGYSNIAVVVPLNSPINNIRDLLERARKNPGGLNVGNAGIASGGQMAAAWFQVHTQTKFTEIPYKGAAPALVDLIGGRTDAQFEAFPSVLSHIKAGRVKPIAVTTKTRSPLLPDVPTVDESGAPGYESSSWTAFLVPARTPDAIVNRLNAAFNKSLADPALVQRLSDNFGSAPGGGTPAVATSYLTNKYRENDTIFKAIGVVPK